MGGRVSPRKEFNPYDRTTYPSGPMSRDDAMKKVFEYAPPSNRKAPDAQLTKNNTNVDSIANFDKYL